MDAYDYSDDTLTIIARSCKFLNYKGSGRIRNMPQDVSCRDCAIWNGLDCAGNHLSNIALENGLD